MLVSELIKQSDLAFENLKSKKTSITNFEAEEMACNAAGSLNLERQRKHYEIQKRVLILQSFGYNRMTLDDISIALFNKKCRTVSTKSDFTFKDGRREITYTKKHGSPKINLTHYIAPTIYEIRGPVYRPTRSYNGYGDKVHFKDQPYGFFGVQQTLGYLSSPDYLNQPIPPAILARMLELSNTGLINCFYAAGFTDAFSFEKEEIKIEKVDPIILAVIDEGTGISSPFNDNTHMFFVGKYN